MKEGGEEAGGEDVGEEDGGFVAEAHAAVEQARFAEAFDAGECAADNGRMGSVGVSNDAEHIEISAE